MPGSIAPGSWTSLFEASASAAAALTGLTFVAISLNVKEILDRGGIAERALAAVLELLGIVIVAILALVPQPRAALGAELIVSGVALCLANAVLLRLSLAQRSPGTDRYLGSALTCLFPGPLCLLVAGASLVAVQAAGLDWTVAAIALALIGGVTTAWILLIEILR